jgi:diguanylate cyclase (GGDEF)-like protein
MDSGRRTAIAIPSERPKTAGQPCLVMIAGSELGRRIDLGAEAVEIGRSEQCTVCVDSDQVSRRHAVIQRVLGRYYVVDQNSTNGTFINERRIETQKLEDGDQIRVGKTVLKYMESHVELQYIQHIDNLANQDSLTGAYNKRYFDEALAREIRRARQAGAPFGLIVFDVDHFKKINDTHGHVAGDTVLKGVVDTVKARLRRDDLLCRIGGEEFALILPNATDSLARQIAEEARAAVEGSEYSFEGTRIPVTLSLGVAVLSGGDVPETVHKRADEALYAAKRGGRNRVA